MKSRAGPSGGGGMGMKCRNMFEPKTTKITPSRLRAMIVAIFIVFFLFFFLFLPAFLKAAAVLLFFLMVACVVLLFMRVGPGRALIAYGPKPAPFPDRWHCSPRLRRARLPHP